MLSAIVLAPSQSDADAIADRAQEAVVRSLSALVGAAVADLVRDACIVGPPDLRLEKIADHAGCGFVADADPRRGLEQALAAARSERALLLRAGYAPMAGFIDEMSDWLVSASAPAAALRREPDDFLRRLFPALSPCVGVVALRREILSAAGADPRAIAGALRARSLRTRARRVL